MAADETVLDRNLRAIAERCPGVAERLRREAPRTAIGFAPAEDGLLAGWLVEGGTTRQLCSRRQPRAEAQRLADGVDIASSAVVVVRGMGMGHHVALLAERLGAHGAIIVFEPDLGLLRAVLERVDLSPAAARTNLIVLTDPSDTGAMASAVTGIEALLASGTTILDHPPSRARLGASAEVFGTAFAGVMKAVRTNVVTTLVHADVTLRNLVQNIAYYASCPGVDDLAGRGTGRPAVVVSAGPSLKRNIDLLAAPGVRDRVVIIAVQTVLKQLLSRGIRPHFVTALDYHEISRRFYEGLTAADVEGVTLVAEPKANPAILRAFPGVIRCPAEDVLDRILGPAMARRRGELPNGATVAHLAYYLARHLGCDPVILAGQDLGFTDGQYYSEGAAIHTVWGPELGEFRTLEMFEWERIARMPSLLRRTTDHLGRPIYTDEQMATYLVQFERDFMADDMRGLRVIDATEGGVRKQHTRIMPLAEALSTFRAFGPTPGFAPAGGPACRVRAVRDRVAAVRASAARVGGRCREAGAILRRMLDQHADQASVNRLIAEVNKVSEQAMGEEAYWLAQHVNQTGQLNRFKADRALEAASDLPPLERQKREIQRDITNVQWLGDAADQVVEILDQGVRVLDGGPIVTRDSNAPRVVGGEEPGGKLTAFVLADTGRTGLGLPRDSLLPWANGKTRLAHTLDRLAAARRVAGVVVLTDDPERAHAAAGRWPGGLRVEFQRIEASDYRRRAASVAASRLWSRASWRGGIANLTSFDEAAHPGALAAAMARAGVEAGLVLGADWSLVDPGLIDAVTHRHLENPGKHPIAFTQAPPGLAPMALSRAGAEQMARSGGFTGTVGALLGYVPAAAQADPIAKGVCVDVDARVRDTLWRCIPDTPVLSGALAPLAGLDALTIAARLAELGHAVETVELALDAEADPIAVDDALRAGLEGADCPSLTLCATSGTGAALVAMTADAARAMGYAGVHLRLGVDALGAGVVLASPGFGLDVLSVDLDADTGEALMRRWGRSDIEVVREELCRMFDAAGGGSGLPRPWIVPRMTRRDSTYEQIEGFYARWIMTLGAAVIDTPWDATPDERIQPLTWPCGARARRLATHRVLTPHAAPLAPQNA
ncbi:MAG: DUF115 domain-containing protein [Leptolyngbya sp. PLA1]|nr:DUF115 domain-containing protein [Leptolyngbya sp. PLA1]